MHIWQKNNTGEDAVVRVTIGQKIYGEFPLDEDYTETIDFGEGEYNTIVIKDGEVYILEASCPDQICVNHSHIRYAKESIVCLPHELVITVEGGQENEIDSMTN